MAEFRVEDLDQRGSEALLESFFAAAAVGLSITDLSGRFVKVNPAYCALTGYSEAELKARDFQSITHPDDLPRTLAKFQNLLSGDISSLLIEKRYIRKDAVIVWVLNSVSLIRNRKGRPTHLVRLSQDITEQLQLEGSLRQAEVRTESILANITDVYLLFDHHWRYLYANDAAVRAIGRPREQILGRTLWELFPDIVGTDLESECRRAMDERVTVNFDFFYQARDNWWENRFYPVPSGLALFATDITARRRADTLLRQSKNQLVEAQHLAHIGSWHWDLQTNSRSWSEELYRIFGRDPEGPAPSFETSLVESVHPDDRELVKSAVEDSIKSGQPSSFVFRIVRPDGAVRFIHSRGNVIVDESGNPTRMFGTAHDITERRRAEDSLREAERKYRDIFENAVEGIFQTTPDGRFITANPALARMLGFETPEELIRVRTDIEGSHYVHPERRVEFKRLLDQHDTVREFEYQAYRKDGIKVWISDNVRAVRDASGNLLYFEGTVQDVTERKQAEDALRRSEMELADFFENAAMGLHWVSPEGTILRINQAELDLLGYARDECLGHHIAEFHADSDVIEDILERLRAGEVLRDYEARLRCKDGSIKYVLINSSVYWEEGKFVHTRCFTRDISEQKRAEEAMSKLAAIVEFSDDAIIGKTLEGTITSWNKGAEVMYGYLADEVMGREISILIPPDRSDELPAILEKIGQGQAVTHYETERVRKDGQIINVSLTVSPIENADGIVIGASTIARNITARKRAAQVEKELHQRISDILENIGEGFVAIDREWRYTYVNRHAAEMLERRPEELVGKHVWTEFPNAVGGAGYHAHQLVMNERRSLEVEDHYAPLDRWFQNIVYPTPDGLAICFRDVTEQKHAEAALRESEKRFRLIAETITEVFWMADINIQTMAYVSPAYERVWGRNRESLYKFPRSFLDAIHVDDRARVLADLELKENGQSFDHEYRIIRPDGVVRWIWDRGFPVKNESGKVTHFVGLAQDITERKRVEAALRESKQELLLFNQATNDMFWKWEFATDKVVRSIGFERAFGYAEIEIQPSISWWEERLHPDDQERVLTEFRTALQDGDKTCSYEYRFRRRDGSYATVSDRAYIVRDESGNGVRAMGAMTDITERKQVEAALRESEERFSKAFYSSPAPLIITRVIDGCFLNVNDSFLRTFGYVRDEVIGKTVADLNIYIDQQDRVQLIEDLREQGALRGYESRARTKDGRILDLLVFVEPVKLKGEQCILSTAYDITERKSMEEALRESEERYRELFENAKDALYVHDLGGRYTSFNRAAEQLSGFSRNEIIGKHFSNFVAPASLRSVRENLCKKLDDEGETTYEIDLITKDRRRVPVEVSSRLIYENGEPFGVQGVARDISERKRADEARARLALIVESSDDAIIGKTLEGTILSWNSGAERIYGYSAREVIGCHIGILVPPDRIDEMPRHLEMIRRGESISHYETLGRTKDGQLINVSLTISPIRDARNQIVGGSTISRDITKSKQAEQALQTFSRRLIEAQEAERQHIARELHDEIGQVLTAVRLNLESLQGSTPAGIEPPQLDESLGIVDEALDRVRELSLNLRPPVLDNLGLSSALRWYVDRYARSSGLVAELRNDLEDGQRLHLDLETACFRIVQEALTNVARHAHATHVLVHLTRANGTLNLKIRDDGVGFDAEAMVKDAPPAWALGLRGMEERAVAVRGRLKIDSAPMRGTEVSVTFPLREDG